MEVSVTRTTTEKKELTVPERWAMFTAAGNRRLRTIAQRAFDKVQKLIDSGQNTHENVRKVLISYLVSWLRLGNTKKYGEAGDTAVRECVGDFHDKLWEAAGLMGGYDRWEEHLAEAYRKVHSRR